MKIRSLTSAHRLALLCLGLVACARAQSGNAPSGSDPGKADGPPVHCADGVLDGNESDVDCGGNCIGCGDGASCTGDLDCASLYCVDHQCAPGGSTPTDGCASGHPSCGTGEVCMDGACHCGPMSSPSGQVCDPLLSDHCGDDGCRCGGSGAACTAGQRCLGGACLCDSSACAGCCQGNACMSACGSGGMSCTNAGCQAMLGSAAVCNGDGSCSCAPSCAGKACGADDGCGGKCMTGSCSGAGQVCTAGTCGCTGASCQAALGASSTCNVNTGACSCVPSCTTASCGQPDGCGGTCKCCYQCNGGDYYTDTAYCQTSTVVANSDGSCPSGYSNPAPDCRPCWDCRVSNGYCPNAGCCGNWQTTGVVGGGCTCYSCQGFAYDFDKTTSCNLAKGWTHGGGPSPNSTCPWPTAQESTSCGYYKPDCSCFLIHCGGTCAL